jgi:sugar lactone lactonase YvrE
MIIAYRPRLALRDADGRETPIAPPPDWDAERERFNDGACDVRGRFWVGTMDRRFKEPVGALYCIDADLKIRRMQGGIGLSNGIAWTADSATMFHCDSRPGVIHAYDFDPDTGTLANRRVFMAPTPTIGLPDGCAVDTDGCLWFAAPETGQVIRLDPDGRVERRIPTPASKPTSVVFGGANLRTLFITSMQPLEGEPHETDGAVFALEAPTSGVPKRRFASQVRA